MFSLPLNGIDEPLVLDDIILCCFKYELLGGHTNNEDGSDFGIEY
jgi:hypothetical protein